jgi:hypothetical protein
MQAKIGGAMNHVNEDRPTEDEKAASRRRKGVGAKVGKRVGGVALRGAASAARLAGRAAVGGGKAAVSSGRRAGKQRKS